MQMPGRKFNTAKLVNGFNGKRYDNDVYGEGNFQDYGMRMYDPRLVRFPSVDPITKKYPELTPYQFASNRPIDGVDEDGLEYTTSSTYVSKPGPLLNPFTAKSLSINITGKQATIGPDPFPYGTPQSRALKANYEQNKALRGATMDPLAGVGIYMAGTTASGIVNGTINGVNDHADGIYWGVKNKDYQKIFWNSAGLVLDVAPFVFMKGGGALTETFYRTMTAEQAVIFEKTGVMSAGTETMISPTAAYAKSYTGVTFEINTKAGTLKDLLKVGVRDPAHSLTKSLNLPALKSGWMKENAFFKMESNAKAGLGEQINIGLGNGKVLEKFNKNITSFKRISTQPPPQ